MIVTTSWDDGYKLDLRLAHILLDYGINGTFYIPKESKYRTLSDRDIKYLARNFEIGAHSLTHPDLCSLSTENLAHEVQGSKFYIENLTNENCKMFCYPMGFVNSKVRQSVIDAGFNGARTVEGFCNAVSSDSYMIPTTMQACMYSLEKTKTEPNRLAVHALDHLLNLQKIPKNTIEYSWGDLAKHTFEIIKSLDENAVWHLWGHSWEIERFNLWEEIISFFKFISRHNSVRFLTNSEANTLL